MFSRDVQKRCKKYENIALLMLQYKGVQRYLIASSSSSSSSSYISVMELGHFLTRSGLTCPEVSSKVCHDI
jgi:hypothetical protein